MAWERRERGGLYYTRSRRVDGRVVREYVGRGEDADLIAALEAIDREERVLEVEAWRRERARAAERWATSRQFSRLVDDLTAAELRRAGLHEHKGEWRWPLRRP